MLRAAKPRYQEGPAALPLRDSNTVLFSEELPRETEERQKRDRRETDERKKRERRETEERQKRDKRERDKRQKRYLFASYLDDDLGDFNHFLLLNDLRDFNDFLAKLNLRDFGDFLYKFNFRNFHHILLRCTYTSNTHRQTETYRQICSPYGS